MSDLISRSALIKAVETIEARYGNDNSSLIEQGEVLDLIAEAPTVDAVEVVRCRECIHHKDEEPGMVYCPAVMGGWVGNEFYCADGERKKGRFTNSDYE